MFPDMQSESTGVCLGEKSVPPLANAELHGEGDMTNSGQDTVKYRRARDLRRFGNFT